MTHPSEGAWLPAPVVARLLRLPLRRSSCWRVLLAVVTTSARYGGGDALLGIADLADLTGLAERTVKGALGDLFRAGLLVRVARGRLAAPWLSEAGGAVGPKAFTRKQEATVHRALREVGRLLGLDASALPLSVSQAEELGLGAGTTLGAAFREVGLSGDRAKACAFVKVVLGLRFGDEVHGEPV